MGQEEAALARQQLMLQQQQILLGQYENMKPEDKDLQFLYAPPSKGQNIMKGTSPSAPQISPNLDGVYQNFVGTTNNPLNPPKSTGKSTKGSGTSKSKKAATKNAVENPTFAGAAKLSQTKLKKLTADNFKYIEKLAAKKKLIVQPLTKSS